MLCVFHCTVAGCSRVLPLELVLSRLSAFSKVSGDVQRLPHSLQMLRFLQLSRLRASSTLNNLPSKILSACKSPLEVQEQLTSLCEAVEIKMSDAVKEAAEPAKEEGRDGATTDPVASAADLSTTSGQNEDLAPIQSLLLSQFLSNAGKFYEHALHFATRQLGEQFVASPQINLNTLLQVGKPVLILRPDSDLAETSISDLLKAATKVSSWPLSISVKHIAAAYHNLFIM